MEVRSYVLVLVDPWMLECRTDGVAYLVHEASGGGSRLILCVREIFILRKGVRPGYCYSSRNSRDGIIRVFAIYQIMSGLENIHRYKDVGCRSNFDPSRPLYTQDTSFSVKSSLTAVCQGVQFKTLSTDIFAPCI